MPCKYVPFMNKVNDNDDNDDDEILGLRLFKDHCNLNCRLNSFVCRNVSVWHRVPAHDVAYIAMVLQRLNASSPA